MTACTAPTTVPAVVATTCVAVSSAPPTFAPTRFTTPRARDGAFVTARFTRVIMPRRFVVFRVDFLVVFFVVFFIVPRRIDAPRRPPRAALFVDFLLDFFDDFFMDRRAAFFVAFFLAISVSPL